MVHPASQTDFDWAYIYYVGRNVIGLSEEEFWDSSIDKINELVEVHGAMNDDKLAKKRRKKRTRQESKANKNVYIDQISYL